jgi:inosose dehydratase
MSNIKWGYAMNQWNTYYNTMRPEQIERALKVVSICGFQGIEMQVGTGRWSLFGRPELINLSFNSAGDFNRFLHSCNIDRVVSWNYDPCKYSDEEDTYGRNPSNPSEHAGIVDAVRPFAEYLKTIGGSYVVARPMSSYWKEAPVTDEKIRNAADCWNKVGKMTLGYGIKTLLHIDWLNAIHSMADIDKILEYTNPELVGLVIDTAEFTIAGIDPLAVYAKHHDRVELFHFKDVQVIDSLNEYKTNLADRLLNDGGQRKIERWFWEMGRPEGLVDFPALYRAIKNHDYSGWIIVESDQSPNPAESAMLNNWYIKNVLDKI